MLDTILIQKEIYERQEDTPGEETWDESAQKGVKDTKNKVKVTGESRCNPSLEEEGSRRQQEAD